jgi:MYXO-CTERM domain-containing protein
MRRTALALGGLLGALGTGSVAGAHPGHGLAAEGLLHYATEPLHVAPLALIAFGFLLARRRRARMRAPSR